MKQIRTLVIEKSAFEDLRLENFEDSAIESLTIRVFERSKLANIYAFPDYQRLKQKCTQLDPIISRLKTLILVEDTGSSYDYYNDLSVYLRTALEKGVRIQFLVLIIKKTLRIASNTKIPDHLFECVFGIQNLIHLKVDGILGLLELQQIVNTNVKLQKIDVVVIIPALDP